ncbi:MAG: hypothetical protein ACYDH1_15445 [Anaerolineaceae bacterium]
MKLIRVIQQKCSVPKAKERHVLLKKLNKSIFVNNRKVALILSFVIFVGCACNLMDHVRAPDVISTNENQASGRPTLNIIKPNVIATDPKPKESVIEPSKTPSENQSPVNETSQPTASEIKVIGGWYGPACDEAEGTYYYRWSVDLMENAATGGFIGVAKFHDCPGGGRVSYYLTGDPHTGNVINLKGEKTDSGGGTLFGSAAQTIDFTFDLTNGNITPNLAP